MSFELLRGKAAATRAGASPARTLYEARPLPGRGQAQPIPYTKPDTGRGPGQGQAQPVPYTKRPCPDHYTKRSNQGRGKPSPYPIRSVAQTEDQGGGKPSPYPIRSTTTTRAGPSSALALGILVRIVCGLLSKK